MADSSEGLTNTGTGAETIPAAETTPTLNNTTPIAHATTGSWFDSLDEDIKKEPSIQSFKDKDTKELAKSYVSAQKMIGSSVRIPGPDASAEAKAEFYKKLSDVPGVMRLPDPQDPDSVRQFNSKLGIPEKPEGYKVTIPPNTPADPMMVDGFKHFAHSLKLNNDQVNGLIQYEIQRQQQTMEQMRKGVDNAKSTLSQEWGNEFDNRLGLAKEAANHFKGKYPQAVQELMDTPIGSNVVFLQMAAELGRLYREEGVISGDRPSTGGLTPEEARARIGEIRGNREHPFNSRNNDQARKAAVQEMNKLYEAAYPETRQSDSI